MTTPASGTPAATPATVVAVTAPKRPTEIRIYQHSMILYWWPVWLAGFIAAAFSFYQDTRAVIVPANSTYDASIADSKTMPDAAKPYGGKPVIVLPKDTANPTNAKGEIGVRTARSKDLGVAFTIVLLIVVFVTNTPLRGLWSAVVILLIVIIMLILAWRHMWGPILHFFGELSIHMNVGFFLFFSVILFALWAVVVFLFDRTHYWKFTPGQVTYEALFGGGQKAYDSQGMVFEKRLDDIFRHWMLGLGTSDLIITLSGTNQRETVHIANVAFLTQNKIRRLENMIAEKPD